MLKKMALYVSARFLCDWALNQWFLDRSTFASNQPQPALYVTGQFWILMKFL